LPLPAGHHKDRFEDRTHGHRVQEDARGKVILGASASDFAVSASTFSSRQFVASR
jgi:hypothetical protein